MDGMVVVKGTQQTPMIPRYPSLIFFLLFREYVAEEETYCSVYFGAIYSFCKKQMLKH